ncbi:MAG: thioredoxin [Acidiferrobacteraceae bacterium]
MASPAETLHSVDVTGASFDKEVIGYSRQVPVLVDFWAAWCGPCRVLMPLLGRLASEYNGAFRLAKLNTDAEHALSAQYGVRSLPTVKLFRDGVVADEFMGAQPESAVRAFIDRHVSRPSDRAVADALAAATDGDPGAALARLRAVAAEDPANPRVSEHLVRLLLDQGEIEEAESVLRALRGDDARRGEIPMLMARLELMKLLQGAPAATELERRVGTNPDDLAARLHLGARYALAGRYEDGLDQLIEVIRRDRSFREDAGRKAILSVFNLLGGKGELVKRYRALLSALLN